MKKLLLLLWSVVAWSQSEIVTNVNFGASIDFTNQPISPQADYSRSQVIYYKENLRFKGDINQIRYKTSFSGISLENSYHWVVKLGTTSLEEYGNGVGFIGQSQLTEVFNGVVSSGPGEIIINFTTPFYYSGLENLVIEVEEVTPGSTSSGLSGFLGREDFNNPPKRSIMTLTDGGGTYLYIENSYPATRFFGNLERCISPVVQTSPQNVTQTTATIILQNNPLISTYHYAVYTNGTPFPDDLETTTSTTIDFIDLLPAEKYRFSAISDCFDPLPMFGNTTFDTKPIEISIPQTITFDGENTRNYFLPTGYLGSSSVDAVAAENSNNGLLFRSTDFQMNVPSFSTSGDIWTNNTSYIAKAEFIIDLTNNPTNPIFTFRLKQKVGATLRVKIGNNQVGWNYKSVAGGDVNFETIVVDLKNNIGQKIDLTIEHVSDFYIVNQRSSWVDTIELKEETCLIQSQDFVVSKTTNSISLSNLDTAIQYDVAIVPQSSTLTDNSWTTTTLPYTFDALNVASAYKVYIRKKCDSENSKWLELFETTLPENILPPYTASFANNTTGIYVAPKYNLSSEVNFTSGYPVVALHQKSANTSWIGGLNTTESQAWNDNKHFISSLYMIVDAQNTSTLNMTIRNRVRRLGSANTSWFRILINEEQIGPSYQGAVNAQYQNLLINLNAFAGTLFTVELQHSGQSSGFLFAGNDDRVDISSIMFDNTTLSIQENQINTIKAFPNPIQNSLTLSCNNQMETIQVFNTQGQLIERISNYEKAELVLDTSKWSTGLYLVHITSNKSNFIQKIIKE
ncbi:hypothetical protein J2X31_003122 [Flavobacterium arsenatis]|uniref:Secretion system C-terminal sorting domain-containing protein n=1 Tax=Flavobacterium arsenatis TaxID=1484332 RepID=A0ABU1TTD6_9FLAO|nr:T9SS type A sorting domain-containing protein [Flavobacterium arsenatis]MDR6969096.1 hypothetical protein [Flavobacterium arsenatis]